MSKLSFRARALDASKAMPVFRAEEIPDLSDFAAVNRAVPQMPTGMEKEEECEHHLQRAISAQQTYGHTGELVIPTPECVTTSESYYNELYPADYKSPRQLIFVQPFGIDKNLPDYDLDSEDEQWLAQQQDALNISTLKFEEIIECLEKNSGQHVVDLNDAKNLIQEHDVVVSAVYDYWLSKRLKVQHPLIHLVRTEKRDGASNNNPYVAFRRRTEKMQTRKNRKNDEASYEKMLKLKRDLSKAVTLLEMVNRRERMKKDHLKLTIDIFDKRYRIGDFSGQVLAEVSALKHIKPVSSYLSTHHPHHNQQQSHRIPGEKVQQKDDSAPKKRRDYKRKHKADSRNRPELVDHHDYVMTSDDETAPGPQSDPEDDDPDGQYAFRRTAGCSYLAPLADDCWSSVEQDARFRFSLSSIPQPDSHFIGFIRRRIGRGGRIVFDRIKSPELDLLPVPPHPVLGNDNDRTGVGIGNNRATGDVDHVFQYESDDEGNQIPVIQIPLSDLISGSGRSLYSSSQRPRTPDLIRMDGGVAKSGGHIPDPHSCSPASVTPAVDYKQAKTLDAARAQMAVSAVYNNILSSPTATSLDGLSGKNCQLKLADPVLSNGPDRLNTMH